MVSLTKDIRESVERPFSHVAIEIVVVSTPSQRRQKYIITAMCLLPKFVVSEPSSNIRTSTVMEFLEKQVFLKFGRPSRILSDRGTQFTSTEYRELMEKLIVRVTHTSGYRPWCNGALEKVQGTLKSIIKFYVDRSPGEWSEWLPYAVWAYNTRVHSVTGYSPYYLLFGVQPMGEIDLKLGLVELTGAMAAPEGLPHVYHEKALKARQHAWNRMNIISAQLEKRVNKHRKSRKFELGEKVYALKMLKPSGTTTFNYEPYEGPFIIMAKGRNDNYMLSSSAWKTNRLWQCHGDRLVRCHERPDAYIPVANLDAQEESSLAEK
ncbi:Retrovirus-related Pol polyprotein from transposon [Halotydeus destructor]|nr:Retrovirus-related Pol polyprotein from transposon [Halotydeus destructor]